MASDYKGKATFCNISFPNNPVITKEIMDTKKSPLARFRKKCYDIVMKNLDTFVDLIRESKHCVAFTGAGISTLSGIKDFRGKDGLYEQPETEKMFDINVFRQDPSVYYRLAKDFIYGLEEKKPAIVHTFLAKLEKAKILKAIITQNIDLLHQKAGSEKVFEVHGSPAVHKCQKCGYTETFADVEKTARKGEVPKCRQCGGVLKPEITFFGESLPMQALMDSEKHAKAADLMLVLGSSLTVYPAAALPEITLRSGGKLVIVNAQATHLDELATLRFEDLAETFEYLNEHFL